MIHNPPDNVSWVLFCSCSKTIKKRMSFDSKGIWAMEFFKKCPDWLFLKQTRDRSRLFWSFSFIPTRKFIERCRMFSCGCVSWQRKQKSTVNSKKYYLCYKDYRIIDSKRLHFVSEMFDSYHPGLRRVKPKYLISTIEDLLNIIIPGQTFTCLHAFSPKWQL